MEAQRGLNGGPEEPQWRLRGAPVEVLRRLSVGSVEPQRSSDGASEGAQWNLREGPEEPQ